MTTRRFKTPLTGLLGAFLWVCLTPLSGWAQEPESTPPATEDAPAETALGPSEEAAQTPMGRMQQEIDVLGIQAGGALAEAEIFRDEFEDVGALVSELEVLADRARRVRTIRSMDELEQLRDDLIDRSLRLHQAVGEARAAQATQREPQSGGTDPAAADTSPPVPSPSTPAVETEDLGATPAALLEAARAFFAGEYEAAVNASGEDFEHARDRALAALLRGAARYAQYVKGGEQEEAMLADAQRDVKSCRELAPGLEPDTSAFSPRFVEFFRDTTR